jgi:glycosyltransferase involved in cell wall biosynthesis
MKLSIAVCTHNEGHYVAKLLTDLCDFVEKLTFRSNNESPHSYEIVVVDDSSDDDATVNALGKFAYRASSFGYGIWRFHRLNGDFATHKNYMNSLCTGDWILNLDADESIPFDLLSNLPLIIESNPLVEAYWFPRINTVDGLTLSHVQKWGWLLTTMEGFRTVKELDKNGEEYKLLQQYGFIENEEGSFVTYHQPIINWPDPQMRLYKNSPNIKWEGRVHERLTGFDNFTLMPYDPDFAIRHFKEIKRQEEQNTYYETIKR